MSNLRNGFTTGTCAAAAAKAAAMLLNGSQPPADVDVSLPDGTIVNLPIAYTKQRQNIAEAAVRKDAGDDPDITDKTMIVVCASFSKGNDMVFKAGEGVGTVTLPGLSIPPGEPAINPVPRDIIRKAVQEVIKQALELTVSIPGGKKLAKKTFNPRLGIVDGLSILGTDGRVRPFSVQALQCALECTLNVAQATGISAPVFVPGHIGKRAALKHLKVTDRQIVEVSNKWGFMLERAVKLKFKHLLLMGHPGKLAKLADNQWDTHSSMSGSAVPIISDLAKKQLDKKIPESPTVEGIFAALPITERQALGNKTAELIRQSVIDKFGAPFEYAVIIVNMAGEILGSAGDLTVWR